MTPTSAAIAIILPASPTSGTYGIHLMQGFGDESFPTSEELAATPGAPRTRAGGPTSGQTVGANMGDHRAADLGRCHVPGSLPSNSSAVTVAGMCMGYRVHHQHRGSAAAAPRGGRRQTRRLDDYHWLRISCILLGWLPLSSL
ncbi:MAG: hypothetical protein ACR2OU_00535 [Thermomicrobiales bacterium]